MDKVLRRRRWIVHRRLEGWKIADIAETLSVSEKTVDRWCSIHRKYGWEGLEMKSHAPHTVHKTPQATVDLVLKLRRERLWGPCKIAGYLKKHDEAVAPISHATVYKILVEANLNNPISRPRKVWGKRRFERLYSNSLWQADFKMTEKDEWMISCLDDHSRFIPGSRIHHNPTSEHAIKLLEESIRQYGKPDQILTDRGTQFHPARGGGPSAFTEFCSGNSIQHIVTSVRRPSTIGKIEAFHKSYKLEAWMFPTHKQFVDYWNYQRPHQGLSYLYPADVYFRDLERDTS